MVSLAIYPRISPYDNNLQVSSHLSIYHNTHYRNRAQGTPHYVYSYHETFPHNMYLPLPYNITTTKQPWIIHLQTQTIPMRHREHGLVAMTLASHARGPEFDPRCSYYIYYTCTPNFRLFNGLLWIYREYTHIFQYMCRHFVCIIACDIYNAGILQGSISCLYIKKLSWVLSSTDRPWPLSSIS